MKPEIKKQIMLHLPYLAFVYLFGKVGQAFRLAQGADLSGKLLHIGQGFSAAFASAAPSFHPTDLLIGLAAAVIIRLVVYSKQKNAKKYRKGMEYGTARWGTVADIKPFIDPVFDNNVLLTQTERLMMSNRPKDPKNARNKNILVIGGSGSGKTRFFCKPNIMQLHSSYVITDPKGSLICEVGQLLQRAKYRIAVLNTINFSKSMHYNPFAYLRTEKDILKLVNTIIINTKGEGAQSTEDFWVKAERLYYTALIGYIHYEAPEEEKNFITLLDMINDIKELRDLMAYDEMELDTIGDRKTALFLIMSDTDSTFNFVIAILQSQLTNLLCDKADDVYGGRLPIHVRFILDEFANIGQIPQFDKLIATIRSREISASIILQSQSQLKTIYKDAADTIVGNCDVTLFLGGKEKSTLKEISELLGKETIDSLSQSENRGAQTSHGLSYQKLGKELMTQDEIAVMDGGKCILQLRGVRPFFSDKYDLTKHPRYKYLSDADKMNTFDVERYIRVQRKKKKHPSAVIVPEEPFDLYEIELSDEDADFTAAE